MKIKIKTKKANKSTKPAAAEKPAKSTAEKPAKTKVKKGRRKSDVFLHYPAKQILAHREMSTNLQALKDEIETMTGSFREAMDLMPPGSKRGDKFLLESRLYRMSNYGYEVKCDGYDHPIEFTDPE